MTENYEQELKLINGATDGDPHEDWCISNIPYVVQCNCRNVGWRSSSVLFDNYFDPAHMRQRIEREMAKDERINELEEVLRTIVTISDRKHNAWDKAKELLK